MSFLNDNDNDELDDSKISDLVISQSRCFTRLNESTIVETSRRILTLNKLMIELTVNETSCCFTRKRVFVIFVIFHRDVVQARKNKILRR